MDARYDVAGLGNALVDALVRMDDKALLEEFGLSRGLMTPVDFETWEQLYQRVRGHGVEVASGGSCANTIAALGLMGLSAIYRGQVGDDEMGRLYAQSMDEACGGHDLRPDPAFPTGRCLSIVGHEDAERTLLTFLGGAVLMPDLDRFGDIIRASRLLHLTGYLVLDEPMASRAWESVEIAEAAGVPISIDVADPFVVGMVKDAMWEIVRGHADMVFLNADEARALTGREPEAALSLLADEVRTVVLKLGKQGALVSDNGEIIRQGIHPVTAVDTTGAGDSFAAGFLYGHLQGWPTTHSADLGARVAALTVGQLGAVVRDASVLAKAVEAARPR